MHLPDVAVEKMQKILPRPGLTKMRVGLDHEVAMSSHRRVLRANRVWFAQKDERFARYWEAREEMTGALEILVSEAVTDGAFGVPYFHTDKGDFFGNDRIDFLVEAFAV